MIAMSKKQYARMTAELLEEATQLRRQGMSLRKIATKLGVSRQTLSMAFQGRIQKLKSAPRPTIHYPKVSNPNSSDYVAHDYVIEYVRCSGCGGKVQKNVPCLACQVKRQMIQDFDCYLSELLDEYCPAYPSPLQKKGSTP
jgi:DNA-binding XRE family transcriptional regulator